jgi:hypothetical protein
MGAAIGLSGLIHGIKNQRWMMVLGLIVGLAAIVL